MVVFTCNHCGESLQKPKVEKHYSFVCRRNKFLTCVDCLKDFNGEEYSAHVKCMTEEERYAAKGTYKNGIVKKGEVKQEQWSDMIRSILNDNTNLKPKCKNVLNHIVSFTNVPRKKPKFMNFMKNTMGGRADNATVEEVWNVIEEHKKKVTPVENTVKKTETAEPNNQNGNSKRKNTESEDADNKSSKKIKTETDNLPDKNESTNNSEDTNATFQIKDEILKVLNKKGSIALTKLQKKIFKKYKAGKDEVDSEKFEKRFNKKLKKISNIVIEDDMVSIKNE